MVLAVLFAAQAARGGSADQEHEPERRALLIGCSRYGLTTIPELWGPENDVRLWRTTLIERFGFTGADISELVGWPDDPMRRPTHDNIVGAFEDLVQRTGSGDQVVIVLSGHGAQVPAHAGSGEADGLEEVFLPADVQRWDGEGIVGGIGDDDIRKWLDRLKRQGAHVWGVFDCCHSGTMTRGHGAEPIERPRSVRGVDLGVPDFAVRQARELARAGSSPVQGDSAPAHAREGGSLAAFFAAQSFEETPELPRPVDASRERANYYGLLSFTMLTSIGRRQGPMTYRELERAVAAQYLAERRQRPPTAFAEGDLDREVLGQVVLPRDDLLLGPVGAPRMMSGGALSGIRPGAVLVAHPPAGDGRPREHVLGHIRVVTANVAESSVEPVAFAGAPAVGSDSLPEGARCELVASGTESSGVKLAVVGTDASAVATTNDALNALPETVRSRCTVVADPAAADWWLVASPSGVQLRAGTAAPPELDDPANAEPRSREVDPVVRSYDLGPGLSNELARDLPKVARWQDLWRISEALGEPTAGSDRVALELSRYRSAEDNEPEPIGLEGLVPGDWLEIRLRNAGRRDLWITLLYLDPRFGVAEVPTEQVRAGESLVCERLEVTDESFGREGLIAIGLPIETHRSRPDFGMLMQEPLGRSDPQAQRMRGASAPSAFVQFLDEQTAESQTRGLRRSASTDPLIASASWRTSPKREAPDRP